MKLTEQEKQQLRQATTQSGLAHPPKTRVLSAADYFARLEQFALILPRRKKPVAFEGNHWRL